MTPVPVENTEDPASATGPLVAIDVPAAKSRGNFLSNLTLGQIGGVGGLLLLLSGGGGTITSAMMMGGGDVVKQQDLEELETRLREDLAKDRQLELLAQEQRLVTELGELGHKLDVIARELDIDLK